jgi:hypothetical protein
MWQPLKTHLATSFAIFTEEGESIREAGEFLG